MSATEYAWRLCDGLGLAPSIRRCYLALRTGPNGWTYRRQVGAAEATFTTKTWLEYQRVRTLFGEARILKSFLGDLKRDDIVWDVGANIGLYSCFAAERVTSGTVVGFEPEPNNRARLESNLLANAPSERWLTSAVALYDEDRPGWLASAHEASRRTEAGAGHHYLTDSPAEGAVSVTCRRGTTLIEEGFPAPTVVKVDVQGAEGRVLRGMGDVLAGVGTMYLEVHPEKCTRYGSTAEGIERYLEGEGYTLTYLGEPAWEKKSVYYIRAVR